MHKLILYIKCLIMIICVILVYIHVRLVFCSEFRRTGGKRFFALEKPSEIKVQYVVIDHKTFCLFCLNY